MSFTPTTYRGVWADDVRLVIDGLDVTYFRGVPVGIGGWQLQEPYAFGPADFTLPQLTAFEVARFGTKALPWVRTGARCELFPATSGAYGDRLWAGVVTSLDVASDGVVLHADGELSGRMSVRDKQPGVFSFKKDAGLQVFEAIANTGIRLHPFLGPKTGLAWYTSGGGSDLLSYVNDILSQCLTDNGGQWTVARRVTGKGYEMRLKDTTTVHATVFLGAAGVDLAVTRDATEEPTTIYGTGTDPNGVKITNAVIPNLFAGEPATYPFADGRSFGVGTLNADTDDGAGMTALTRKLVGMGFLARDDAETAAYDDDTALAVKALQRRAGLPRTGIVNRATWDKLFNVTVTGRTLYGARVLPMAQLDAVTRYFLTSNGSVDAGNPDYDPARMVVDRTIDHGGGVTKERMLAFSGRLLDRLNTEKDWTGTLDLGADVFAGDVDAETVDPVPMSRLALREGQNVKVVGFDGDTLFHVSGINVSADRSVSCAVDTRARDLLTLGQIIARNKESRRSAGRDFIHSVRRPNALDTMVVSNELFGMLDERKLTGGRWNRLMVPCGQSGTIDRVRVHLRDDRTPFVMGVSVRSIAPGQMAILGSSDPLGSGESLWAKGGVQHYLKSRYLFLYTAGQNTQPLGYYPRAATGDDGKATSAAVTGDWEDDAGFAFRTFNQGKVTGVLYVYIFPADDCTIQGGKVFYVNETEGA